MFTSDNSINVNSKKEEYVYVEPILSLTMDKSNEYPMKLKIVNYEELRDFEDINSISQLKLVELYNSKDNRIYKENNNRDSQNYKKINKRLCNCISSRNYFYICKSISEYINMFKSKYMFLSTITELKEDTPKFFNDLFETS